MRKTACKGWWAGLIILTLLVGCAKKQVPLPEEYATTPYQEQQPAVVHREAKREPPPRKPPQKAGKKDYSIVHRTITEKELRRIEQHNADLDFYTTLEILCRLNKKDKEYVRADMSHKRRMAVPKEFASYKDWSPLPGRISGIERFPKFILVVKDLPFLGWYERGQLVGDTYVCIGKMNTWTKRGMYRVKEKDPNHMSTYPNAFGDPALMPYAMRIYDRVWIHTGDVIGPNCSKGCINVPIYHSEKLYNWTQIGTAVLITESLKDLGKDSKLGFTPDTKKPAPVPAKEEPKETAQKSNI